MTCINFPKTLKFLSNYKSLSKQFIIIFNNRNFASKKYKEQTKGSSPNLIPVDESKRFVIDCFVASDTPHQHAKAMADLLIEADYRGHFSHGMNRLEMYINDLHAQTTDGKAIPTIDKETAATALVNGQNGLGAVVGNFCMELAIKKAKDIGVGWVSAYHANHYGIAGWYSMMAMNQGLIGLSMCNTSPLMSPTRSKEAALGTNPISIAARGTNGDSFVLDMATTAVAVGKIEMQKRKNEPLPHGWAQDPDGEITNDPELAFHTGCLMPLGGPEILSGYKGYGLSAAVEILCGISSGSNFATKIRKWSHSGGTEAANLGQVFIAVDPKCFAPNFENRLTELNNILRGLARKDESQPVLVPGDPELIHMKKVDENGGIEYHENQIQTCENLANRLNVKNIRFVEDLK